MTDQLSVEELVNRSWDEPARQRRATLLEAIEVADAANDLDQGFRTRSMYINACHGEPDPLLMIAHYGWCLARYDEDPERFRISFWNYKWIANAAPDFAGVSSEQLYELVEDLRRRFDGLGASPGPAGVALCEVDEAVGDLDALREHLDTWKNTPKTGSLNDCAACDDASEAGFQIALGRHTEAIEAAEPLISGNRQCATQPHHAFAALLAAARATGDTELAEQMSVQGLALLRDNPDFVSPFGDHMRHFAITGELDKGLEIARRIEAHGADRRLLSFYRGVRLLLERATLMGRDDDVTDLREAFEGKAEEVAARFDARNANTYISDLLTADSAELTAAG